MPKSHKSCKSSKYLTIIAIVLLAVVVVPYAVVEKARRDAAKSVELHDEHLELIDIQFDRKSWLLFNFKGTPDTPDAESTISSVVWSLYPWEFRESAGVMRGDFIIISDRFTESDSETEFEDEETTVTADDHSQADVIPPLKADRNNIDQSLP